MHFKKMSHGIMCLYFRRVRVRAHLGGPEFLLEPQPCPGFLLAFRFLLASQTISSHPVRRDAMLAARTVGFILATDAQRGRGGPRGRRAHNWSAIAGHQRNGGPCSTYRPRDPR